VDLKLLDPAALRARVTSRAYWRLRLTDGRVVNEWEVDWSLAPARGRQALRLYCPNGEVAELGNSRDASGRLFQFKGGLLEGDRRAIEYQVIGIVEDGDGNCRCAAWEYHSHRLVAFLDNVHNMTYHQVGALSPDVLGLKV